MSNHKQQICEQLDTMQGEGLIAYYQLQSKMPGLRWSICVKGQSTFSYNTGEMLAFLRGVYIAQDRHHEPILAQPTAT